MADIKSYVLNRLGRNTTDENSNTSDERQKIIERINKRKSSGEYEFNDVSNEYDRLYEELLNRRSQVSDVNSENNGVQKDWSSGKTRINLGTKKEQVEDRFSSERRGKIYDPKEEEYIQSEKAEADTRAAKQAKITEAKNKADSMTETEKGKSGIDNFIDSLNYINARGAQAFDAWNENLNTLGETAYNAIKSGASALKNYDGGGDKLVLPSLYNKNKPVAVNISNGETISDSELKSEIKKGGAITAVKDAVKKAVSESFEKAASEDKNAKTLAEVEEKYPKQSSNPAIKVLADLNAGIMNMLPSVASSAVNPFLGAVTLGAVSMPDSYTEARKNGANVSQALKMAAREFVNQGLGDILLVGLGGIGKGVLQRGIDALTNGALSRYTKRALAKLATSPIGKTAVSYIGSMLGEGVEESLQSLVTTINERITYNDEAKVNWGEVAYEGLLGSLMGGVFSASQIPANYKTYKSDADIVNNFAKAASSISSDEESDVLHSVGEFIVEQMRETVKNAGDDNDLKERAEFIGGAVSDIIDGLDENGADIIQKNNDISDVVESIASSPAEDIVDNTARLVDVMADNVEPDKDPVKSSIDVIRDLIASAREEAAAAQTLEERREAQVNEEVLKEIDSTLRNKKEEVNKAREELPENNLTIPENSDIVDNGNTDAVKETNAAAEPIPERQYLEYVTQKHTKTGEKLNVLRIPSHVDSAEYTKIKNQIKKIGGYYSTFAKGFIIPEENMAKAGDILDEIGLDLKGYSPKNDSDAPTEPNTADTNENTADTKTAPKIASLTYPDGIKASDKVAFTRMFKKWAANEHVNITDMTSDRAAEFASFASKLYSAGYNGIKPIGNYANLADNESVDFPYFLQDIFYNLGKKARGETNTDEQGVKTETAVAQAESAAELDKGENIPDSGIEMQKDGDDYSASPEIQIADYVENKLANGEKIETKDLQETANSAFGGTQAEGKYDVKSMTDAMELGVNKRLISLIEENRSDFNSSNPSDAVESIREINEDILSQIPTQTKRSEEQVAMQQFSTPPNIAYVAAWAANIDGNDSVLEPSAGIGGLASFAKAFGADVTVNELSERRLELLKNLPFDAFYNENAEQINNILPDSVKPTVVLMNPPFSANGRTKNTTKNAIPHIEQALLRLEDGGRLVAIVGRGMADDSATFKNWWNELRNEYDIRANIGINGENYRKYGTTFDVQLVVIDKTGPQKGETITGYYDNLENIPEILKGVRNDRTRTNEGNKTAERNTSVSGGETTGVKEVSGGTRSDTGGGSVSVSGRSDTGGRFGMEVSDADSAGNNGRSGMDVENGGLQAEVQSKGDIRLSDDSRGRGRLEGGTNTGSNTDQRAGGLDSGKSGSGTDGQSGGVVQAESGIPGAAVEDKPKKSGKKASANDDGVYADYKTVPLTVKNAKKHPAKLVESSAMSAVSSPKLTYVPKLDQSLIDSGALSDAQLENISYAGQAHEQKLPSGERKGYFIGDGTGVGKGRQIAGIIMDEWNRGRKKAIWVSENKNLSEDARRDWKDLGGDANDIVDWEKVQKKGLPDKGILFIPYSSLAGKKGKTRNRDVEEIIADWFGKDYDGVIVYDEAHNMGNLIPIKGARGSNKTSQKAISGNKLQSDLPNARVVYASATGATNIQNLAFAARLGLWGEGTSFVNNSDFANKIARAGIAAMELVARDMKAMGVYLARSISYEGVKYSTLQHKLTSDQRMMYDGMSKGWQVVLQNFDKAVSITNSANSADVKKRRGQVYGSMQLFYNQVLTSMSMPAVIKDIEKRLADGKSCVIQLVNTNESAQEEAVSEAKSSGKSNLDDIDLTPRQLLIGYVDNSFPIEQYEEYIDENGNKASRVAVDSSGKPIINKQAQKMKEELIAQLNEISIPEGPLDMLLNHFGADNVAEITGRRGRVLTVTDENGNEHKQYVKRDSAKANIAEAKDFQDGKKRILVFSNAGSTGRSFHSDLRAKNQQQRIHYVLQPGWKADTAVQGFGRTHRSNQANAPEYVLVSTDVMGHKRFVTSIARRLDQLGALTKGQRQTGSGIFGEKDNLESPLSSQALREFYRRLGNGRIPGLDAQDVLGKMGLDKAFYDEFGRFKINEDTASDITKFLNRLLALPVEEQNKVFTAFEDIRDSYYQAAVENGTLDMGLENVKADKVEIKQDDVVYTDSVTGAETRYVKATLYRKPEVLNTVEAAEGYHDNFKGLYRMQDGSVRAAYRLADKTDELGRVNKYYLLVSPNVSKQSRYIESTLNAKAEAIPKEQWNSAWEDEVKSVPAYNENDIHMITGALLPIWDRLPETGIRAQRITTEDGTSYLGRIINRDMIDSTLRGLGVNAVKQKYTGSQVYDEIMKNGKTATMKGTNGGTLTISKRRVSGENRLEVSGSNTFLLPAKYDGIFSETINYSKRYFIPTGDKGVAILEKMLGDLGGVRSLDSDDGGAYYSLGTSRGKWGGGGRDSQVMSISELTRQAKNIFGVEINTGKVGKRGASGIFKTHAGTIRTRVYGDIPTISHELGHWFDKKYNLRSSPALSELTSYFKSDLKDAGYTDSLIPAESIAEYFASYFKDKGKTEQKFKKFTKWLYDNLSDRDLRKLYDYAGMTNAYFAADLERRADAQIHTRTDDGSVRSRAQMQLDALKQNPSAYMGTLSRKFTYLFIDDLADLKNFGKAYDLAMLEKNCASVVAGRLSYMFRDNNGKVIGKSLHAILSDGSINDMNRLEFDKYLVACRALDQIIAAEKAKPGENAPTMVYGDAELQDKDSIMSRIEEYERSNPTFHDAAEEIYGYGRNLLYVSVQSGLISEDLMNKLIEKYPHHVPLNRVMETVVTRDGKVKRGYADQKAPIMKFKGSGRDIYSPIENLMLHTEQITKACMRNKVMSEFTDYIDSNEDFGWAAEKVPASKVYTTVSTEAITERLKNFGTEKINRLKPMEAEEIIDDVLGAIGGYVGEWKTAPKQGKNIVSVMREGKPTYYEIHDKDLLDCLTALDDASMNMIVKALGGATAEFKVLTTGSNPIFAVTNVQRDLQSGYVSSSTTNNPFKYTADFTKSFIGALKKSDSYKEYISLGGGYSDAISYDVSRLKRSKNEVIKTTNNLKAVTNKIGGIISDLVDAGEVATRLAEFERARKLGIDALEAVRMSQEISVNFARGGKIVKEIDKFIPYFRASVNSMYHLFDVLTKGSKKELASRWTKFVGLNAVMALMNLTWQFISPYLFGEDEDEVDEAYETLSNYNKNAYWCYYTGDGKFFRIAKPKDMTVPATVIQRMVECYALGDVNALYGLGGYVLDSLCPPTEAMIFGTALDLAKNETFTGAPIVPQAYQNLAPALQYSGSTSKASTALGGLLNVSPMKLDYILTDNTGYVGQLITNLLRNDGKVNLGFLNKFSVDSVYSTDEANIFYDRKEKYDTGAASYKATFGENEKYSSSDVYGSYKYAKIASTYSSLNKFMKAEGNKNLSRSMKSSMNDFLKAVNDNPTTELDKAVMDIAETTGAVISDIAPYVVIPDTVTYQSNGYKEKFDLSFDEMLQYYTESQIILNSWYTDILESGYSDEEMAEAMKSTKNEVAKQMRDRWEEIKFNQKYN
jgi:hypothetical protein